MNNIILIGNLTRDLTLKQSQSGKEYLQSCIAVSRPFKGEGNQPETDFINFTAFGSTAKYLATYGSKGLKLAISGRLEISTYTKQDGTTRRDAVVMVDRAELLERREKEVTPSQAYAEATSQPQPQQTQNIEVNNQYDIADEDLPF